MSKGFKKFLPVWVIFVVALNATAWIMPLIRSKSFWIVYGFVNVSWLVDLVLAYFIFKKRKEVAYPVFALMFFNLIVLFIVDAVGLYYFWEPWVIALISMIILAVTYLLATLFVQNTEKAANRDENQNKKVNFMREMTASVKTLYDNTNNEDIYRLYEAFRYSNKASGENTKPIEKKIKEEVLKLKEADKDEIKSIVDSAIALLKERDNI